MRTDRIASRVVLALALVLALTGLPGCEDLGVDGGGDRSLETTPGREATRPAEGTPGAPLPDSGEGSVAGAAEAVLPSVVNVATRQAMENPHGEGRAEIEVGTGSGVIIRPDGHIITNNHVIAGSDEIVVLIGDEEVSASVVGRDAATDLAVIKVDREGLDPAQVGETGDLVVGQWVIAVGSPFGLDKTVTAGVVSALGRTTLQPSQEEITAYTNLIQTDAAINPGNSGGALADLDGRVVGINTLIESPTGQSAGIGFAIPMDFAMGVAEQLIETGRAEHAFMGVEVSSIPPGAEEQLGVESGAVVGAVEPGSPAAEAGIQDGDVIVRVGDDDVDNAEDLFAAIRGREVGEQVEVEFVRDGESETVRVTLAGRTSESRQEDSGDATPQTPPEDIPGLPPGHP
ncbi:MAG: trypsin-like peptidase domain-containing protein [Coriobacteriia bacterium]|nr:trypsin-like peptidase domain-containing protein [Coriobacteriia bacterium]